MNTISILHDAHVLLLMSDKRTSKALTRMFEGLGATVHTSDSQVEAIGLYWRLFKAGIRPRIVVTSWWTTDPESNEYKYLEMIDRVEMDGTALNLLLNITDLDPSAFLTVYTQDPAGAQECLDKAHIKAEVFNRIELDLADFVARVSTHSLVNNQRLQAEEVSQALHTQEQARKATTQSSCELTPVCRFG
jgi:hypothetical protein